MDSNMPEGVPTEAGKVEKRTPRSIRFYDPEWERFEAFSDRCGLAAAEFARFAAIGAVPGRRRVPDPRDRLAPLIEMTFHATYLLATKCATRCSPRAAGKNWTRRSPPPAGYRKRC